MVLLVVALGQNTSHVLLDARTQPPLLLPEAGSPAQRASSIVHAKQWLAENPGFIAACFLAVELTTERLRKVACVLNVIPPKLVHVRDIKSLAAEPPGDNGTTLRYDRGAQPPHEQLRWAPPDTLVSPSAAALCAAACGFRPVSPAPISHDARRSLPSLATSRG